MRSTIPVCEQTIQGLTNMEPANIGRATLHAHDFRFGVDPLANGQHATAIVTVEECSGLVSADLKRTPEHLKQRRRHCQYPPAQVGTKQLHRMTVLYTKPYNVKPFCLQRCYVNAQLVIRFPRFFCDT